MTRKRVVITGLGLITPCGMGHEAYWDAVSTGRSGIQYLNQFEANDFPSRLAGQIAGFDPSKFIQQRKSQKVMSREIQIAVAASRLAIEDSLLDMKAVDRFRFGISLGAGLINMELDDLAPGIHRSLDEQGQFSMNRFGQEGIRALFPLWFLKYLPNMPACHISIAHGLQGPSNTVTTSAAAGAQAIGEAFQVIERGDADLMLAGGTDSKINPMGMSRFHLLGLLSRRNSVPPEQVYCPFDSRRDGMILGEGAGLLLLEEYEHAKCRGARIYAELMGYGASSDFNCDPRVTHDCRGKYLAMERAIEESGVDTSDIGFILANGSGIPQDDIHEAHSIHQLFGTGTEKLKVTGVKPVTGHLIYGAGGVEAAAAVLALHHGVVPPLLNLEERDPLCDLPVVTGHAAEMQKPFGLINSAGFGGQNATLLVKK